MERWLPRGYKTTDGVVVGKLLSYRDEWQLYSTTDKGYLVAISPFLYERWSALNLLPMGLFSKAEESQRSLWIASDKYDCMIASVKSGPYPENYNDASAFALALKISRATIKDASFDDAIYFEKYSLVLPTYGDRNADDQNVLCRWIASGVEISLDRFDRLCELVSWMSPSALLNVIHQAGFTVADDCALAIEKTQPKEQDKTSAATIEKAKLNSMGDRFTLPGRPQLESFFNEHVVDIIQNAEKYQRMGIDFPSAIILHGPPGCGKTFAVDKLIDFLGWPSFHIDSGSIGSPFIHDTSKKISEAFDAAIENAPSIMVIDEMEAFLSSREQGQGTVQHHMEEVAEFLRRIPEATSKRVLVIAMTNLIDLIDPAILRRGRFDHIVEVHMPSKEEVSALLHHLLASLPVSDDLDYEHASSMLAGHAMSDVTFVVKEAGRLAVKGNEEFISNQLINLAIDSLPKKKESSRRIGF